MGFTRRQFIASSLLLSLYPQIVIPKNKNEDRPNILWITSEDNSPLLGCYGDDYATTPHLDKLASEGVLYENAFANAPVCAPTRSTILTGMYACSLGTQNMRSRYAIPSFVKPYTHYLRKEGYYCSNRSKTDYNIDMKDKSAWDDCSPTAHYKNRKQGQPFFSIFNSTSTHESRLHEKTTLRHDPAKVKLPPYHPDTQEIRNDWAHYYDCVENLDTEVGEILDQLEKDGLAENTIVFYYSDHGGVLSRSKRFIYDSGTRVPFIIRFPEKYKHLAPAKPGSKIDRMVSFVDFAPTLLNLAGCDIPKQMQGKSFLGPGQSKPNDYVFLFRNRMDERIDFMRAVRDKNYKYIRNFMPNRIYGQHLEFLWKAPNTVSWEKEFKEGRCNKEQSLFWQTKPVEELYDIKNDPYEVTSLADDPEYKDVLERMRNATIDWMINIKDTGLIPEGEYIERTKQVTGFELTRDNNFPYEKILRTANKPLKGNELNKELNKNLEDKEACVRYWTCEIINSTEDDVEVDMELLKNIAVEDESHDVRIATAELLHNLGEKDMALEVLEKELHSKNSKVVLHALNVLDNIELGSNEGLSFVNTLIANPHDKYIKRLGEQLMEKIK